MEEPEKTPGVTYLLLTSGDSKEVRNYRPIMCLTTMFKTLTGIVARIIFTHLKKAELITSRTKWMPPWQ
jgi:hypothetical protein